MDLGNCWKLLRISFDSSSKIVWLGFVEIKAIVRVRLVQNS